MRTKPTAVFMAFGTKGDVYPVAAIAAGFASDQDQYNVVLITHSAHENLKAHLATRNIAYLPLSTPPVLSLLEDNNAAELDSEKSSFYWKKREITRKHRQECVSIVEGIFGDGPVLEGDFIVINFFALEGWSLAELYNLRCIIAAPYVVPYSAPSSFERHFKKELPLLYEYLKEAPTDKVNWKDVIHWMWPIFTEEWGAWRSDHLNLSPLPFTDPVTALPTWHDRLASPPLLYGFSKEVVEFPGYWPTNAQVCGFWFLPMEWQFSCKKCGEIAAFMSRGHMMAIDDTCLAHTNLYSYLDSPESMPPIFVGLSSAGSMGFLKNPHVFLRVLKAVLDITSHRFILFSAGYEPFDAAVQVMAAENSADLKERHCSEGGNYLFGGRLFFFPGSVPYNWLFPRCAAAIHHGGSGSTAAALQAGIPQVLCPFMLDQFYWAERMFWLGVSPEPLKRDLLLPEIDDDSSIREAAKLLARAVDYALSPNIEARALEVAKILSLEDGVLKAVKILKKEINSLENVKLNNILSWRSSGSVPARSPVVACGPGDHLNQQRSQETQGEIRSCGKTGKTTGTS